MFADLKQTEFLQMHTGRGNTSATNAMGDPVFAGPCPLSTKYEPASGYPDPIDWVSKGGTKRTLPLL